MTRRVADGGGVHLTFGVDPATSMVVSWLTDGPVSRPMARFAPVDPDAAEAGEAYATTRTYRDAARRRIHVQHATLVGLRPGVRYRYEIFPPLGGEEPSTGEFRTAPRAGGTSGTTGAREGANGASVAGATFTFTCFGDHGTDQEDDPYGSPASGAVVAAVDMLAPLFHLALGDLSYASLRRDPSQVWADWFRMVAPSASRRPWMPVAGNHESERELGRFGLDPYQAYFQLPDNGAGGDFRELWYTFAVGRVRFVVLFGEDACYQEHGLVYLRGFSEGRQTAWLERTLRAARADPEIDWVIVAIHQVAVSTAAYHNGGDLGLREEWLPLFDRYEVDLVLCGHEHHYERTHPVRGVIPGSPVLTPRPVVPANATAASTGAAVSPTAPTVPMAAMAAMAARTAASPGLALADEAVDTTTGTVHIIIGTGGSSSPSTGALFDPPAGRVVVRPEPPDPPAAPVRRRFGKSPVSRRRTIHVTEGAPWLAARSTDHPYAFAALHVDPGLPGGTTTIRLTVHDSLAPDEPPFDEVLFTRPRRDGAPA
ncbi:metallophosphoesterase family protein [Pseudofrankia sp. BMG5.36]|uniref:purple acid phosphatase family protein n=1 Tax=Pseudofrankia sp. BMG5.36 TaxID=1834512 RepID=UPI0008D906AA|nr:metallophosphoesterase family protein [Pseudofrankia sp. BMG5.36]OHV42724.1 metallophosphoesterase [Pseudofrankia sp. BMG5.36]